MQHYVSNRRKNKETVCNIFFFIKNTKNINRYVYKNLLHSRSTTVINLTNFYIQTTLGYKECIQKFTAFMPDQGINTSNFYIHIILNSIITTKQQHKQQQQHKGKETFFFQIFSPHPQYNDKIKNDRIGFQNLCFFFNISI